MKNCHFPSLFAARLALPVTPRIMPKSTSQIRKLLFALCFLLFFGVSQSYAADITLVNTDASGVLLELRLDDLSIGSKELDNRNYHLISYDGCSFTADTGKSRLPVSHAFIGVPTSASISVSVVDSQISELYGYTPAPVPDQIQQTSPNGVDALVEKFTIDRNFYRQNTFYPTENAVLVYEGYVRSQRVAVVELRPIQYNPARQILRKYSRLLVRVDFSRDADADLGVNISGSMTAKDDKQFEELYQGLLLNYNDAKKWREVRAAPVNTALAPETEATAEALKLFTSKQGIYRLDYAMILGAGVDPVEIDPRTIKVYTRGSQVPIYIRGEADGKFDPDDYVEFFCARAHNIYTRWDIYRLTWGGARGMRMAQRGGSPVAFKAHEVTSFTSVERFEEDHLHHKLQNVQPDPTDPEAWFESRDHWFWEGVENGSAKTEATVEFPVYDPAQSLMRPSLKIELVGCTNFEHNVMMTINGYKVGDEAQWERQDTYFYEGQVSANALQEGINEFRITRIGTNPGDGANTDNYPYQVYLNWFEIAYVRKLLAVNDSLIFSAPEVEDDEEEGVNRYTIAGFMSDDIEIFQITNSKAVCKIKNIDIRKYAMEREEHDRLQKMHSMLGESAVFDIENSAYRAVFEDAGGRAAQYIAVTPSSVLMPERIELDTPSNLKSTSNQADYIIISHPTFMQFANELSDWRSTIGGGGYRTMVIDVTDVYDEFGFGMASPHAIKDFLKYTYNNWTQPSPAYVLIFGDATYDYLGINEEFYDEAPELTAFIPSFYIHTTFGQTAADHWYSTIQGDDGFPDIYLGRIPVEDVFEAESVLKKILANESGNVNGQWRRQIISIADDDTHAAGDEQFQIGLEDIYQNYTPLGYNTNRIYLKDIIQQVEQDPEETRRPAELVEGMIIDAFADRAVIAQYSGHGGRHVWAHEIIFSIVDIEKMRDIEVYPFMLVLSCYNGYFDLPGELSMAEGLLRADGRGIVAMLSATRLTYGSGNIALNKLLFEGIFEENLLRLGQATAISKTRLLVQEGMNWLSQMQEYTLFGDPASRLNIADYDIQIQLDDPAVAAGGSLKVPTGRVVKQISGEPVSFNGQMTATVYFPDGSELSKPAIISNGSYPAISFDIPGAMMGGEGMLKLYGENSTEVAVGGTKFSIEQPAIISVEPEISGDQAQFYAKVSDEAGIAGIKSVVLSWKSHGNWKTEESEMIFDKQKDAYKLGQVVSLTPNDNALTYHVTVEDVEGHSVSSESQTVFLFSKPNLTVFNPQGNSGPSISYGYSAQTHEQGLNVQIENSEYTEIDCSVSVYAFRANPDKDNNKVLDDGVLPIGKARISPDDWISEGLTSAFIPLSLSAGNHIIFVWVDPEVDSNDEISGECSELNESDNISYKLLGASQTLLKPAQSVKTASIDGVLKIDLMEGSVAGDTAVALEAVGDIQQPFNQPAVSFVPLPESKQAAYSILPVDSETKNLEFQRPGMLQMQFNFATFADNVKNEIGLGDIPSDQLIPEQIEALEQNLKERLSQIAIHRWYEEAQKWANISSEPLWNDDGNILRNIYNTIPSSKNIGDGDIQVDTVQADDAATPVGEWAIFFVSSDRYQLYFRKPGALLQKLSDKTVSVGQIYYDDESTGTGTGIRFSVAQGDIRFQFGDVLRFSTTESIDQAGSRTVRVNDVRSATTNDVLVQNISIDEGHNPPIDEWVIFFLDSEHFHLQGSQTGVIERNSEPYIGTIGEEFFDQGTGLRFTIIPGAVTPGTGHRFTFKTIETGSIQAPLDATGTYSLMFNRDTRPPVIQMDIAHQNFADGDAVSSEPTIHALISDDNGVDVLMRKISIAISSDGEDFIPAGADEYTFNWDASSNDVPVNYWPGKLETGEYEVKLQAYDFNGNVSTSSIKFVVKGDFKLMDRSLINYPNPFEKETDITFRVTSLADEAVVKIYTVSGRLIRTLEQNYAVNFVVMHWDGRDEDGDEVANGAYYYKLRLKREGREDIVEIGKMMKLK